jgi:hypothetical protein
VRSAAFSLAVGLVLADSSVAVLALPAIYRDDLGDLHWVLTTFNLVLALVPTPAARVTRASPQVALALWQAPERDRLPGRTHQTVRQTADSRRGRSAHSEQGSDG